MQRAAVSVCSNIAEGFGRRSYKEKDQFYAVANGSLIELKNQILIANGINYLTDQDRAKLYDICDQTHKMLASLQQVNRTKGESR